MFLTLMHFCISMGLDVHDLFLSDYHPQLLFSQALRVLAQLTIPLATFLMDIFVTTRFLYPLLMISFQLY